MFNSGHNQIKKDSETLIATEISIKQVSVALFSKTNEKQTPFKYPPNRKVFF